MFWTVTTHGGKAVSKKGLTGVIKSGKYEKFSKTLLPVGGKTEGFDRVVGQQLEIMPVTDPATLHPGDEMKVRVLFEGKPLATPIYAGYDGFSKHQNTYAYYTEDCDDDGTASVAITAPGLWMVRVQHKVHEPTTCTTTTSCARSWSSRSARMMRMIALALALAALMPCAVARAHGVAAFPVDEPVRALRFGYSDGSPMAYARCRSSHRARPTWSRRGAHRRAGPFRLRAPWRGPMARVRNGRHGPQGPDARAGGAAGCGLRPCGARGHPTRRNALAGAAGRARPQSFWRTHSWGWRF